MGDAVGSAGITTSGAGTAVAVGTEAVGDGGAAIGSAGDVVAVTGAGDAVSGAAFVAETTATSVLSPPRPPRNTTINTTPRTTANNSPQRAGREIRDVITRSSQELPQGREAEI
jgi:hypothetical protein